MSVKNNSDSEYYGRDLVTWCKVSNVCNMSVKNNSDSKYYGRDLVIIGQKIIMIIVIKSDQIYYGSTIAFAVKCQ